MRFSIIPILINSKPKQNCTFSIKFSEKRTILGADEASTAEQPSTGGIPEISAIPGADTAEGCVTLKFIKYYLFKNLGT